MRLSFKYLIVAETENNGYIVEYHWNLLEAQRRSNYLFGLNLDFTKEKSPEHTENIGFLKHYEIYGQPYLSSPLILSAKSNGVYTVAVLELRDGFNVNMFIAERRNTSTVFGHGSKINQEDMVRYDQLLGKFKDIDWIAN